MLSAAFVVESLSKLLSEVTAIRQTSQVLILLDILQSTVNLKQKYVDTISLNAGL